MHRSRGRREVILSADNLPGNRRSATEWEGGQKDGEMGRVVCIPDGMTIAEGLRALGGYTREELERISVVAPAPLGPGSFFALER